MMKERPGAETLRAFLRRGVRLTLWPGGEEQVLARAHAHGEWIAWKAGAGGAGA